MGLVAHPRLYRAVRITMTFLLVCVAYVVFRAASLKDLGRLFLSLGDGWSRAVQTVREFGFSSHAAFVLSIAGIVTVVLAE